MQVAINYYRSHDGEKFVVNETFELIDKVADCKALFDELEGTLSASWDLMYEAAKSYHDKYGNIDIPKRYFTQEGYSLGLWLQTQRRVYNGTVNGILTQVQIDKLNALGMRWESKSDVSWEKYYEAAKRYYEMNGDLQPKALYVDDNGVDLGRWLAQIRMFRKNGIRSRFLSDERIKSLDDIGMVWDVFDYIWEEYYSAAVKYHREHGDLNVPARYVDRDGIKLGQWLNNLRSARNGAGNGYKELTDEQKKRLDELGMIWENKLNLKWNNAFRALCDYHLKFGTFEMKSGYRTEDGITLGKWVRDQRDMFAKGKLSAERAEKLRGIGFVLEKTDPWEEKFLLAKAYFDEHGDLKVPVDYKVNGVWLNKWVNEQKQIAEGKRKKKHTAEQLERLRNIGLKFDSDI